MKEFNNYMLRKTAGGFLGEAAEGLFAGAGSLVPLALAIPAAGGSAIGYLASKMSSPADSDVEALQKRVLDAEVREQLALTRRKLEALRKKRASRMTEEESMQESRKRDMFV